jgi:hypothetical protein
MCRLLPTVEIANAPSWEGASERRSLDPLNGRSVQCSHHAVLIYYCQCALTSAFFSLTLSAYLSPARI